MLNHKITNLADGTDPNDAVNFKQFSSLDDKYLKRKVNMVCGVAAGYANMIAMLVLNGVPSAYFSNAVNFFIIKQS